MITRPPGSLKRTTLSIGAVLLVVLLLVAGVLVMEQRRLAGDARVIVERTLPQLQEAAEAARRLDRLRSVGELLIAVSDPAERRQRAAAAKELAGHPSLRRDPALAAAADRAAGVLAALADATAAEVPTDSEQLRRQWQVVATELTATADDFSRRSAAAAAADGAAVARAAGRAANSVLGALGALTLALSLGLYLLNRWIHRPLAALGRRATESGLVGAPARTAIDEIHLLNAALQKYDELAARVDEPVADAYIDPLSGLPNRRACDALTAREFDRARRYDRPLSTLALNVDHLGRINAAHGESAGDEVVRVVAARTRKLLRDADLAVRYSPTEFVIFATETPAEMAIQLAERLRIVIAEQPVKLSDGREIAVTVSIGVAELAPTDASIDAVLERAIDALSDARSGLDSVVLHA